MRAEIKFIDGEISFFEDFSNRQWSDFEMSSSAKQILEMQKRDRVNLEEALKFGDYQNAAA